MKRLGWLVVAALTPSVVARADQTTARNLFDQGERAYNLGQFDQAAENFRKAYEQWPEPAFLFNLAQTYRQMGDCKQASFFYKRFLALKEQDTAKPIKPALKAEVEKRIVELDECLKREIANKPPNQLDGAAGTGGLDATTGDATGSGAAGTGGDATAGAGGTGAGGTGAGGTGGTQTAMVDTNGDGIADDSQPETPEDGAGAAVGSQPSQFVLRVGLGGGRFAAGSDLSTNRFVGAIVAGYPLGLNDKLRIDLGAAFTFMSVPYETTDGGGAVVESGSATILGVLANVGPTFQVASKIGIRADVGVGVQLMSGADTMNNPFTVPGSAASGTLSTLLVRAAVSADYAVTPNLAVTVTPVAFTYSPAPDGFADSISSVTTLSFFAGVAYQR